MAVTRVGVAGSADASNGYLNIPYGQAPTAGNLLTLVVSDNGQSPSYCGTPPGWTPVTSNEVVTYNPWYLGAYVFWKVATGADAALQVTSFRSPFGATGLVEEWNSSLGWEANPFRVQAGYGTNQNQTTGVTNLYNPGVNSVSGDFVFAFVAGMVAGTASTASWGGGPVGSSTAFGNGAIYTASAIASGAVSATVTIDCHSTNTYYGASIGALAFIPIKNSAPNAPTLTSPANNAAIDLTILQRFGWVFSDPDAGDSQSKFDLQYRLVGGSTWTAVTGTTPNQFYDFVANTFAPDNYEWQVRTYDSSNVVGPYSASRLFTASGSGFLMFF